MQQIGYYKYGLVIDYRLRLRFAKCFFPFINTCAI